MTSRAKVRINQMNHNDDLICERPPALPDNAICYRTIGPFDGDKIPKGLFGEHSLKAETWGILAILSGQIDYIWDDEKGGMRHLTTGDKMLIPPQLPHHLRLCGEVSVSIGFWRANGEEDQDNSPHSQKII